MSKVIFILSYNISRNVGEKAHIDISIILAWVRLSTPAAERRRGVTGGIMGPETGRQRPRSYGDPIYITESAGTIFSSCNKIYDPFVELCIKIVTEHEHWGFHKYLKMARYEHQQSDDSI